MVIAMRVLIYLCREQFFKGSADGNQCCNKEDHETIQHARLGKANVPRIEVA
jgi:hypothetical protein